MRLADRRYLQMTILGWLAIYGLFLVHVLSAEFHRGASATILAFYVVFSALVAAMLTAVIIAIPLRIAMNVILKDRRRSHRSETVSLTVILVLIVAYIFEVRRERLRLAPPQGVATLSAFADAMPPPQWLELVHKDGHGYIAWFGDLSGPCDVPSGPSCYIFNDNGHLVDWQPETGDAGPVDLFLGSSVRQKQLTLDEALTIARSAMADGDD